MVSQILGLEFMDLFALTPVIIVVAFFLWMLRPPPPGFGF
jgi:hypothetical protein